MQDFNLSFYIIRQDGCPFSAASIVPIHFGKKKPLDGYSEYLVAILYCLLANKGFDPYLKNQWCDLASQGWSTFLALGDERLKGSPCQ